MKIRTPQRFLPRLEALEDRCVPATHRPISDFLLAQGSDDNFNFGVPGLPQELGWGTSTATFEAGVGRFVRIDYTGQDAAFLGLDLGTTTSGTVLEKALPDGTAQVIVTLHTENAFAWATMQDDSLPLENWPVIFGFTPAQLAANPNLKPPLADSDLRAVITIPEPGAPLPDLVDTSLDGLPTGYTLVSVSFHAVAHGSTPTGQQATLVVNQTAPDWPAFTNEIVSIHTNQGNGPSAATSPPAANSGAATPSHAKASAKPSDSNAVDAAWSKASRSRAVDAVMAMSLADLLEWDS